MAVSQKLVERLKSFELQNKHSAAVAELTAQADKAEAEGFKSDHLAIHKKVFDELVKLLPGEVKWVEPQFVRGEVTIEDYNDYAAPQLPDGSHQKIQKPSMPFSVGAVATSGSSEHRTAFIQFGRSIMNGHAVRLGASARSIPAKSASTSAAMATRQCSNS